MSSQYTRAISAGLWNLLAKPYNLNQEGLIRTLCGVNVSGSHFKNAPCSNTSLVVAPGEGGRVRGMCQWYV